MREVLIRLIEAGRIESCADIAFGVTQDTGVHPAERITAIDALVALNDERLGSIAASIAEAAGLWPDRVAHGTVLRIFPKYMSVEQLCRTLLRIKREKLSLGDISRQLPRLIAASPFDTSVLEELRDGLLAIVSEGLERRKVLPGIIGIFNDWPHLNGALAATCERGLDVSQDDQWLRACVIALSFHNPGQYYDEANKSLRERLGGLNAEDNRNLFWVADALLQSLHEVKDPWGRLKMRYESVQLIPDRDLTWVREALGDTTRDEGERAMLLEAAMRLPPVPDIRKEHVEGIRPLIVDEPSFVKRIDDWLKPSEYEEEDRPYEKERVERKKQKERRRAKNLADRVQFWREVANQPENAFSTERGRNTARNLSHAMGDNGDDSRSIGWNRRFIEEHIDLETADRLRRVLMKVWRNDRPTFPRERPESERNKGLGHWRLGLAGIYAEAEDPDWAAKLSGAEVELAVRYALIEPDELSALFELNTLPKWIERLGDAHPNVVSRTVGNELSWELNQSLGDHGYSGLLREIYCAHVRFAKLFVPQLEYWLNDYGDQINGADNHAERVRQVTQVIVKHGDAAEVEGLRERVLQRLERKLPLTLRLVWLSTLMRIDPQTGVKKLEDQAEIVEPSERSDVVVWFARLFGSLEEAIDLGDNRFIPQLLLRLMRLAYRLVQVQDDAHHEDCYSRDTRDDTEAVRNNIVTALLNAKGSDSLAARIEMAADPLYADFKDRMIDADDVFSDTQAVELDRRWKVPASTNADMFAILKDTLFDLHDILRRDTSPRKAWAEISREKLMRREIARELSHAANSIYTVSQEGVTADEKETDIRLCSTASPYEAVIELKLGDRHTAKELRDTIENQLVKKYMAPENRRAGALVVTLAKDRKWKHPDEDHYIDVDKLILLLSKEAKRIEEASVGTVMIAVHFLDLRPPLPLVKAKKS